MDHTQEGYGTPQIVSFFRENRQHIGHIQQICAGGSHSLAYTEKLDEHGKPKQHLFSWGAGNFGQTGTGKSNDGHVQNLV